VNIVDSSLGITEKLIPDETNGSLESIELTNLQNFPFKASLVTPNHDIADQTLIESINGGSHVFETQLDQSVLRQYLVRKQLGVSQGWETATREQFRTLQKWEGYVIEIGIETFRAKLVPIVGEGSDLEAEIYLEEIGEEDRALLELGAVFYWSIGYLDKPSGRRRESIIRFRRLKTLTKRDLQLVDIKVAELRNLFDVE
jgi:hypothetical protein